MVRIDLPRGDLAFWPFSASPYVKNFASYGETYGSWLASLCSLRRPWHVRMARRLLAVAVLLGMAILLFAVLVG
jgi:hypothetical protein